ncbi:hypothetical protein K491DRAFT_220864 [Lophiostoma macrostomum CBS 122681]|uniref:Uncharacterized protein n=1 Tax=Lophiostoma macrostomum CBS 122681 TaxID=1314788 RepID=A0A6A6SN00_9PLEO|nr:hypothetical protein K491DRAFT_220864 [Lophiostoma macrostomum CBS 122681]
MVVSGRVVVKSAVKSKRSAKAAPPSYIGKMESPEHGAEVVEILLPHLWRVAKRSWSSLRIPARGLRQCVPRPMVASLMLRGAHGRDACRLPAMSRHLALERLIIARGIAEHQLTIDREADLEHVSLERPSARRRRPAVDAVACCSERQSSFLQTPPARWTAFSPTVCLRPQGTPITPRARAARHHTRWPNPTPPSRIRKSGNAARRVRCAVLRTTQPSKASYPGCRVGCA